jgi:hypothetical protein
MTHCVKLRVVAVFACASFASTPARAAAPGDAPVIDGRDLERALERARKQFPDAPAVVLHQERTHRCAVADRSLRCTREEARAVIVRRGGAPRFADLTTALVGADTLVSAQGVTVLANGTRVPLDAARIGEVNGGADARTGRAVRTLVVPLEGATAGAVVQHRVVVALEEPPLTDLAVLDAREPILSHTVTLDMPRGVDASLRVFNTREAVTREDTAARTVWRWHLDDVPGHVSEVKAPPPAEARPFHVMVVRKLEATGPDGRPFSVPGGYVIERDAMAWYRELLVTRWDALVRDVVAPRRPEDADPVRWAYDLVRDAVVTRGDAPYVLRPLQQVLDAGAGTAAEKAVLLRWLLEREGVTAHVAATRAAARGPWPRDVFSPLLLTDLVVYVPPRGGVGAGLWLDPTRLDCDAGELPRHAMRREALVLEVTRPNPLGPRESRVVAMQPGGAECPPPVTRLVLRGDLRADGSLWGEVEVSGRGAALQRVRRGMRDNGPAWLGRVLPDFLGHHLRDRVTLRAARGEPGDVPGRATGTAGLTMAAFAFAARDRTLLVPLDALAGPLDAVHWPVTRRTPLRLWAGRRSERVVVIELPHGARVHALPPPRRI